MKFAADMWTRASVVYVAAFAALIALRPGGQAVVRPLDDFGLLAAGIATAMSCLLGASRLSGPTRRAWTLIGLGVAVWAAGQLHWALNQNVFHNITPVPSAADIAFFACYVLLVAGVLSFPSALPVGRLRAVLDGAIVATALGGVAWQLMALYARDDPSTLALLLGYPAGDVVLAVALITVLSRSRLPRPDLRLLMAGACVQIAVNAAYVYLLARGSYETGSIVDIGWALWLALTASAACRASAYEDRRQAARLSPLNVLLPYAAVATAVVVRVWVQASGRKLDTTAFALMIGCVVLVVVRQGVTLLENEALNRNLRRQVHLLRAAETERRQADDLLAAVMSGLPGGAYRYAVGGAFTGRLFASQGYAELTGYTVEELVGQNQVADLCDPRDAEAVDAKLATALAADGDAKLRNRIRRSDGSSIWVENRIRVSRADDGTVIVNGFTVDVTAELAAGREAEHRRRVEAVGRLAAGVAHDVNNILTSLSFYSSALRRDLATGHASPSDLDAIDGAAERAGALSRRLLSFAATGTSDAKRVDLSALLSSVDPLLRGVIGSDVSFRWSAAAELPEVVVDPSRLEQMLLNLVVNGRDACRRGGRVELVARREVVDVLRADMVGIAPGLYVALEAVDDGVGMDASTQELCFDPFFTTKRGAASGLGLATAAAVAREAGGAMTVESTLGRGTRFTALFPAVADSSASVARAT